MTLGMIVYFGLATTGFLSLGNITDILSNSALPVIVAVGLTIPLVMGSSTCRSRRSRVSRTIFYAQLVREGRR